MKIDMGGAKICVSPRPHDGGMTIIQGTSRIRMTRPEALAVLGAMRDELMPARVEADEIEQQQ